MDYGRSGASIVTLSDGRVLIVGSRADSGAYGVVADPHAFNTAEIYDPVTGSFTLTASRQPSTEPRSRREAHPAPTRCRPTTERCTTLGRWCRTGRRRVAHRPDPLVETPRRHDPLVPLRRRLREPGPSSGNPGVRRRADCGAADHARGSQPLRSHGRHVGRLPGARSPAVGGNSPDGSRRAPLETMSPSSTIRRPASG